MNAESIIVYSAYEPQHGFTAIPVEGGGFIYIRAEASDRHYSVALDEANPAPWETLLNTLPAAEAGEKPEGGK